MPDDLFPEPTTGAGAMTHADRVRLESLRYATVQESAEYVAIMRTFTGEISGLLSDQSAAEVAGRLAELGIQIDADTADARLSYLVEHGNLARSPRESEAHSVREYLQTRSRYQLTQIGELVHRQIEELLGTVEQAREVSSEMLGGILTGLTKLDGYDEISLAGADPNELAREIGTVFAQFERLVESTRDFYTYLSQVLARFDLDRAEFQAFKTALLDYLQRFVDEIARNMPQLADVLVRLASRVDALCARANEGGAAALARRQRGAPGERPRPGRLERSAGLVRRRRAAAERRAGRPSARHRRDARVAGQPAPHRVQRRARAEPVRRPAQAGPLVR